MGEKLRSLSICDMEASRTEDKDHILSKIDDTTAFDAALQRLLFDDLLPDWGNLDRVEQLERVARFLCRQETLGQDLQSSSSSESISNSDCEGSSSEVTVSEDFPQSCCISCWPNFRGPD